jgi:hypothetical protein
VVHEIRSFVSRVGFSCLYSAANVETVFSFLNVSESKVTDSVFIPHFHFCIGIKYVLCHASFIFYGTRIMVE